MTDADKAMRAFGYRVASRRGDLDMSQEKLAELCGLSPYAIRKLESGQSDAKASTLMSLCSALGCSSDYLLYGSDIPEESAGADPLLSLMKNAQGKLDGRKMAFFLAQSRSLLENLARL